MRGSPATQQGLLGYRGAAEPRGLGRRPGPVPRLDLRAGGDAALAARPAACAAGQVGLRTPRDKLRGPATAVSIHNFQAGAISRENVEVVPWKHWMLPPPGVGPRPLTQSARPKCGYWGLGGGCPIPVIAQMICHSCGLHSEAAASPHAPSATPCPCGGSRQVVRIVRHLPDGASASSGALERKVQERAGDETLTP
jgi:hypothetical protein